MLPKVSRSISSSILFPPLTRHFAAFRLAPHRLPVFALRNSLFTPFLLFTLVIILSAPTFRLPMSHWLVR